MFNIRDFIMNTLRGMHGHYPDFQIREYALNWYAKGKLTEEDLMEVELMLNPPPVIGVPVEEELNELEGVSEEESSEELS